MTKKSVESIVRESQQDAILRASTANQMREHSAEVARQEKLKYRDEELLRLRRSPQHEALWSSERNQDLIDILYIIFTSGERYNLKAHESRSVFGKKSLNFVKENVPFRINFAGVTVVAPRDDINIELAPKGYAYAIITCPLGGINEQWTDSENRSSKVVQLFIDWDGEPTSGLNYVLRYGHTEYSEGDYQGVSISEVRAASIEQLAQEVGKILVIGAEPYMIHGYSVANSVLTRSIFDVMNVR